MKPSLKYKMKYDIPRSRTVRCHHASRFERRIKGDDITWYTCIVVPVVPRCRLSKCRARLVFKHVTVVVLAVSLRAFFEEKQTGGVKPGGVFLCFNVVKTK